MGKFNNQWVEIFRAGDYGDRGKWQQVEIDKVIANFEAGVWAPPAVFGHPAHDDPAHGWVSALRREGDVLQAQFSKTTSQLENAVQAGRFPNRSAAFYLNPQGKGPVLRHVGFLGATPPEVKGLAPIQFLDGGEHVSIEFKEEDVSNQNPEDTKRTIREAVQEFFAELLGKKTEAAGATFTEAQVKEQIAAAALKLEAVFQEKLDGLDKKLNQRASTDDDEKAKLKVSVFIEKQRVVHRWVPAFDKAGLPAVLAHLAGSAATVSFGEGDKKKEVKLYDAFTTFLESLPELIPSGEVAGQRAFAQATGQPINTQHTEPINIERAQRAQALMRESRTKNPDKPLSYAQARQVVMEEEAASGLPTTPAGGAAAGGV